MSSLHPTHTFATLVVGAPNQLAAAAGRALAEGPRPPFNPLFLLAGAGQGKTHLLHAIGALRQAVDREARVCVTSWAALAEASRDLEVAGRGAALLDAAAEAALLLVDDVERLPEWPGSRGAVLRLLERRLDQGRATVLAGSRPPGALLGPDDPAVRLLGGGLVVELSGPDVGLREGIVRALAAEAGVSFGGPVIEQVVWLPLDSVRDVVAAVSRLVAFQAVSPTPLDAAQARVLITGVLSDDAAPEPEGEVVRALPRPAPERPSPRGAEDPDEFGSFLSDVVAGISQQVDLWRAQVGDAILRWEGEGIHTARLHALLDQELPADPEALLARFEADVAELRTIAAEVRRWAPDLAEEDVLRDPDRLAAAQRLLEQARTRGLAPHPPADHLRLEGFAQGASNRAALQGVREALATPGRAANPLVIVGDPGTGKSHLLHGLGHALGEARVDGVLCLSAQALKREVEEAARRGALAEWQRSHRWAGAFLLDDVHLLAGHGPVQESLLELCDALLADRRPIALTSGVPLVALEGVSPQLLTRLASGLVVELGAPDRELRLDLIRGLLEAAGVPDAPALADYLAGRPAGSVRALQAMVHRLVRAVELEGVAPTPAVARRILETAGVRAGAGGAARAGILGPSATRTRLREKLVEQWPDLRDRLLPELR